MKRILFILFIANLSVGYVSAQGIQFETGAFSEALQKAKEQNKLVFMDIYTDWCGPCKRMSAEVFTQEKVGDFFNKNLINYKINAEKGEGIELAKKYKIKGYPTLLFLDGDGEIKLSLTGSQTADVLLLKAKSAINPDGAETVEDLLEKNKKRFEEGEGDLLFLHDYFQLIPPRHPMKGEVAERYMKNLPASALKTATRSDISKYNSYIDWMPNNRFDKSIFDKILQTYVEKKNETGLNENDKDLFWHVAYKVGSTINSAIQQGNEKTLEDCIDFKERFSNQLEWAVEGDGDACLGTGRMHFYASSDFLRLNFMGANKSNPDRFNQLVAPFMKNLMDEFPLERVWKRNGTTIKEGMSRPDMGLPYLERMSKISAQAIMEWAEYYLSLHPNSKETRDLAAQWLNYASELNYSLHEVVARSAILLDSIGHTEDAIKHLEATLACYSQYGVDAEKKLPEVIQALNSMKGITSKVVKLNTEEFKQLVINPDSVANWKYLGSKPAIIDFTAVWCGPCKILEPRLEKLANKYENDIIIYKVDIDENKTLTRAFEIRGVPTILFVPLEGKPVRENGALSMEKLEELTNDVLLKN